MKYKFEKGALADIDTNIVVVGIFQGEDITVVLQSLDANFSNGRQTFAAGVAEAAKHEGFSGKATQLLSLPTYAALACKKLVLIGLGPSSDFNGKPGLMRKIGAQLGRRFDKSAMASMCVVGRICVAGDSKKSKKSTAAGTAAGTAGAAKEGHSGPGDTACQHVEAFLEGWHLGRYSFEKYKSKKEEDKQKAEIAISFAGDYRKSELFEKACSTGDALAAATNMARSLIAEPASYMTPSRLGEEAVRIASEHGLDCKVYDLPEIKQLKMGSFLGVARGATEPARFITLKYAAANATKTIAVVGKGITFDSGGLSLKPAGSMENMKYDMSGAAAVLGVMQVVGQFKPNVNVLGLIAATENMPGDNALHPGDVLVSMNGKTIEVNNTDAEGRLVLADAITFACKQKVDEIIDLATLTGAVVTALGRAAAAILGTDQNLIAKLIMHGKMAGENLWQLPLYDEYRDYLKSDIADLKNAGSRGEAGTSSAAMFLREFTEGKPWAHLDVCGPGWLDKDKDECNKGGTAFGVRTICRYLLSYS